VPTLREKSTLSTRGTSPRAKTAWLILVCCSVERFAPWTRAPFCLSEEAFFESVPDI
jgi:hypothetical protein